jgi:hypothetical protein
MRDETQPREIPTGKHEADEGHEGKRSNKKSVILSLSKDQTHAAFRNSRKFSSRLQ